MVELVGFNTTFFKTSSSKKESFLHLNRSALAQLNVLLFTAVFVRLNFKTSIERMIIYKFNMQMHPTCWSNITEVLV